MSHTFNEVEVVELQLKHEPEASNILAHAFFDYPLMSYFQPDPLKRERILTWYMGFALRVGRNYGKILSTPGLEGVGIWLPPEKCWISIWRWIRAGMLEAPFRLGFDVFGRTWANDTFLEDTRRHLAPQKHWYLWTIGVNPADRRKGIGSALLSPVLHQADQENMTCYLETHLKENLTWYAKFGFEIVFDGQVPGRALPVWTMLRQPEGKSDSKI